MKKVALLFEVMLLLLSLLSQWQVEWRLSGWLMRRGGRNVGGKLFYPGIYSFTKDAMTI